jgi:hypothetical protein
MIKSIVVAHRKAGMTREEFSRYWLEEHGPLAAKLMPDIPGTEFEGDGIVETWYDDVAAWQKSMEAIRASKELAEDGAKFCDLRDARMWIVEEHIIK